MVIQFNPAESAYRAAKPALAPVANPTASPNPATNAVSNFAETLKTGEQTAKAAMLGQADPHTLVMALTQTELAVETAATLRDRVVEAYQEILRMPV